LRPRAEESGPDVGAQSGTVTEDAHSIMPRAGESGPEVVAQTGADADVRMMDAI
jgi:hypothetical protein